jgi:hypothetical protein
VTRSAANRANVRHRPLSSSSIRVDAQKILSMFPSSVAHFARIESAGLSGEQVEWECPFCSACFERLLASRCKDHSKDTSSPALALLEDIVRVL